MILFKFATPKQPIILIIESIIDLNALKEKLVFSKI